MFYAYCLLWIQLYEISKPIFLKKIKQITEISLVCRRLLKEQ